MWDFRTLTPMERPDASSGNTFLTDEEAAAFRQQTIDVLDADRRDNADRAFGFGSDIERAYNQFWYDYGTTLTEDKRRSLIVDPPDGKIPWTPEGRSRPGTFARAFSGMITPGPEDRALSERCILGFNSGPPMGPSAYNNNVQLFQTPDTVVILNEMVHNVRIIPLDGRPHLAEDPRTFTRAWTAHIPMRRSDGALYEYACHEGNYGMFNLLAGARADERAAAEAGR